MADLSTETSPTLSHGSSMIEWRVHRIPVPRSAHYAILKEAMSRRKELPVCQVRKQILNQLQEARVLVITGETGSGKSTRERMHLFWCLWMLARKGFDTPDSPSHRNSSIYFEHPIAQVCWERTYGGYNTTETCRCGYHCQACRKRDGCASRHEGQYTPIHHPATNNRTRQVGYLCNLLFRWAILSGLKTRRALTPVLSTWQMGLCFGKQWQTHCWKNIPYWYLMRHTRGPYTRIFCLDSWNNFYGKEKTSGWAK